MNTIPPRTESLFARITHRHDAQNNHWEVNSNGQPDYELADLSGNGLPDVIQTNGSVRYWRNLGNGRFDLPCDMRGAPTGLRLADPGVQTVDTDGDGRVDLLALQNGIAGYFPLRFGGYRIVVP